MGMNPFLVILADWRNWRINNRQIIESGPADLLTASSQRQSWKLVFG